MEIWLVIFGTIIAIGYSIHVIAVLRNRIATGEWKWNLVSDKTHVREYQGKGRWMTRRKRQSELEREAMSPAEYKRKRQEFIVKLHAEDEAKKKATYLDEEWDKLFID